MHTRGFKKEDADEVCKLIKKGLSFLIQKKYSKESIKQQIEENSADNLVIKSRKINYFVAVYRTKIVGIGGYNHEEVKTFFVNPEFHRRGIGRKIMERVLSEAKKKGIKTLKCRSTLFAEKFYNILGFRRIKKAIFNKGQENEITFVEMEKEL